MRGRDRRTNSGGNAALCDDATFRLVATVDQRRISSNVGDDPIERRSRPDPGHAALRQVVDRRLLEVGEAGVVR
jgi:hypothetical protein